MLAWAAGSIGPLDSKRYIALGEGALTHNVTLTVGSRYDPPRDPPALHSPNEASVYRTVTGSIQKGTRCAI